MGDLTCLSRLRDPEAGMFQKDLHGHPYLRTGHLWSSGHVSLPPYRTRCWLRAFSASVISNQVVVLPQGCCPLGQSFRMAAGHGGKVGNTYEPKAHSCTCEPCPHSWTGVLSLGLWRGLETVSVECAEGHQWETSAQKWHLAERCFPLGS